MLGNHQLKFKIAPIAAACGLAMLSAPTLSAEVQGRITDVNNKVYFEGALVELKELQRKQVSQRDGSFRFNNVADGDYTLVITYLGTEPQEYSVSVKNDQFTSRTFTIGSREEAMEEVLVLGMAASQANALNRQKNASNLKTIVSADSVGQFPDQNVAEALQRLPGMFVQRDQGEGRFVGIRGIDPNLNNLTINGANIPSPEAGVRSVAMDVIPSELIEGLEVSKTVTPDMDADAIGGSIDVKSLSGFDREGQSFSATVQTSYNEQTEQSSPKLSGSFTDIIDLGDSQLGVAAAASWFKRDFGSHNMETDGGWADTEFGENEDEAFGAAEIEQRSYRVTRERAGLALNLDLHTSATDKYYLRTLFSRFSDDEFRLRNEYKFEDGTLVNADATSASVTAATMDRDVKDRLEEQEINSVVFGGENQLDNWLVEYNLGYSLSTEKEPGRIDTSFEGEDIDMTYQAGQVPVLTQSANGHDLSNFVLDGFETTDGESEDKEFSVKVDLSRDFIFNNYNGEFKFGGKLRQRSKFYDVAVNIYEEDLPEVSAEQFAAVAPTWSLGNFGPGLSREAIRQFYNSNINTTHLTAEDSLIESKGQSYASDEDIFASYAMVTMDIDQWQVVAGLRYESTEFSTQGNKVGADYTDSDSDGDVEDIVALPWVVDKEYSHLLPSLNIRYDVSDKLVTRFAYTKTIARPSFSDSAAFQIIENDDGELIAEVGNPNLDPFESTNIDFSVEYYPGHIGVLSAGYFIKDIDNFILAAEVEDNGQWDQFEEVTQPVNGGSASISGVELAWAKEFDLGLLVAANATFTDADEQIPSQSDTVANFTLGYENNTISTRLTLSHKSEAFVEEDNDANVYEDTHQQLDFNFKVYLSESSLVYFNAINITDEPYYFYHGASQYNYQYETYGSTFELGFTYNSF
ncbi:TonB-dependent receptor [Saccharobesus litoralis]|uniref:TonB-dependent receptor n=1 Tax=Saccharobesus litoralis TaxID=2172099 RepID=A0A2S0VQC4_9ALTE|nr:TonB-dependent receptor [Saccharobesus litoralis]AWB66399.1 TonB-dependent receptor [Saccharobesus litoralis]